MEILVFTLGGLCYSLLEVFYRGYTHWSMTLTGGAVLLTFYLLLPFLMDVPLILAAALGALIVTLYEFSVGCIVNLWFHWNVWDYTDSPGNILGQVCPKYTVYWYGLCLAFFAVVKYNKGIFSL